MQSRLLNTLKGEEMNHELKHVLRLLLRSVILLALTTGIAAVSSRLLGLSCGLNALLLMGMLMTHTMTIILGTSYQKEL